MEKNILMSGCTGFIGQFLVPKLIKKNWHPIIFSRQPRSRITNLFSEQVEVINNFEDTVNNQKIHACINLSGENIFEKSWTDERKHILYSSRVEVTERFCQFVQQLEPSPDVFISGSAVGYYGPQSNHVEIDEQSEPGNDFSSQLCLEWEAATNYLPATVRLCLLRTGIVLHPMFGALTQMLPVFKLGFGGSLGHGKQMMPWIHIEDMVDIIIFLLENHRISGPVNAVAPNAVTNETFSQALSEVLHRPCFMKTPQWIIQLLFGERATLILEGQNVKPAKLVVSQFKFKFPEIKAALAALLTPKA